MFCVPLEKQNVGWTLLGVRIGSGKVGTVEAACKIENCSYVAKIIPFGQNYNKRSFNKEVKINKSLAKKGLAVKVEDSWICNNEGLESGIIIMNVLNITVKDFLNQPSVTENDFDKIIECMKNLIEKVHKLGYYHGDNHFKNIMMKKTSNCASKNTIILSSGCFRMYFIDFDRAGELDNPGKKGNKMTTKESRIRDDYVIFNEERKQASIRFKGEIESMII